MILSLWGVSRLLPFDFAFIHFVAPGGTAGNAIANRLTEDPEIRVLVIESGGSLVMLVTVHSN